MGESITLVCLLSLSASLVSYAVTLAPETDIMRHVASRVPIGAIVVEVVFGSLPVRCCSLESRSLRPAGTGDAGRGPSTCRAQLVAPSAAIGASPAVLR